MWVRRVAHTVVLIPTPRCRPHPDPAHFDIQYGRTPVQTAVAEGQLDCAKLLIAAKADIDFKDKVTRYPYMSEGNREALHLCVCVLEFEHECEC